MTGKKTVRKAHKKYQRKDLLTYKKTVKFIETDIATTDTTPTVDLTQDTSDEEDSDDAPLTHIKIKREKKVKSKAADFF